METKCELDSRNPDSVLGELAKAARSLIVQAKPSPYGIIGAGVGVAGIVDDSGVVLFAPNLEWEQVELKRLLHEELNVPVTIDNEANAGALGEMMYGAATHAADIVYLSVGTGIGSGIV
ncbi:MAG: hypothetical protein K0Q59_4747, partial [Paenibacillus sp.]|nr:hypothetical protein [Paenibacillus sp.]